MKDLEYPLNENVIQRCKDEININSHKGNSWQTVDIRFLMLKLQEEYSEAALAINRDPSMAQKELADLINIAAMLFQRFN